MAQAIPFVTAGIGFIFGGPAGAQVGWMVGAMIYSAVQPAQRIGAGDPSTAPSVGSDIRGQSIPVIFGTVRCSGYLIWQANFKANKSTRKVGSGKKKSKQEFYEYTWDFIFHCGMVTQPYRVIGMWEGSERIQDQSMAPIVFASGEVFRPAVHVEQQENLFNSVGLNFWSFAIGGIRARTMQSAQAAKSSAWGEAYWYGGHGSEDAEDGWAYFQSQANAPDIRWPHSMWIGFKQLELGEQPRIPQYNFEVTPDTAPIQNSYYNGTVRTEFIQDGLNQAPVGVSIAGRYAIYNCDGGDPDDRAGFQVIDTHTGRVVDHITIEECASAFPHLDADQFGDSDFVDSHIIPGTNDIVVVFSGIQPDPGSIYPANEMHTTVTFWSLDEANGQCQPIGAIWWHYNLPFRFPNSIYCVGLDSAQQNLVMIGQVRNSGDVIGITCPYPRNSSGTEGDQTLLDGTLDENMFNSLFSDDASLSANMNYAGFMLPKASGTRAYFYVNKAQIDGNATSGDPNAYILAQGATYPTGFMFYVGLSSTDGSITEGPTICHGDFDQNGPPFDNATLNEDGSTMTSSEMGYKQRFFVGPTNLSEEVPLWMVIFERELSDTINSPVGGMAHSVRIFTVDPASGLFEQVGVEEFQQLEDVCQFYQLPTTDRFDHLRKNTMVAYAPITGELIRLGVLRDSSEYWAFMARVGRARVGIVDFTPPEIIKTIFTNEVLGFSKPADQVDTATYDAAHQFCLDNSILVSGVFAASVERAALFESLVNVYGGWVGWNGYKLRFGKPTEVFSPVYTIDNTCFVQEDQRNPKPPFSGKRQALQDTTNKVTVKYFDRQLSYRQNEVTLGDEVDQDLNGTRHKVLVTGLVMHQDTAYRLAERMLWGNMYSRNVYDDVLVGWKCEHLEPGDPVFLVDSFSNTAVNVRIVRREEARRGKFKLTCVEELDYLGKSRPLMERPQPTVRGIPTTTEQALDFDAYEMPTEFQREGARYYVGYAAGGPTAAAGFYTSPTTVDFTLLQQVLPFPDGGRLASAFPATENVVENALFVVNAKSGANPSSISVWFEGDMADYSSFERASNQSLLRVGSEMMAYEGATLVGSNVFQLDRVYRGVGGTQIQAHSPGDVWWAHQPADGGGIFSIPYAADQIGTEFYYKIVPVGFDGVEYDPSSITPKRYVIGGDHFTPRALDVSDLRVLVGSATFTAPASLANRYGTLAGDGRMNITPHFKRFVSSSDERNLALQWPETSQFTGYGAQGYGVPLYGSFQQDADAVTWDVTVIGSGDTVVRSTSVSTPYFSYDAITNSGDNNGWRGNVAISVRPRNVYGPAPHSAVVSLQLNGF